MPRRLPPLLALIVGKKALDKLACHPKRPSIFCNAVVIQISRCKTVQHVVGERGNDGVDFEPVVELCVLLFVEAADFLVPN